MKILHTSDWHLGKTLENINRIPEQKEFIDELCGIAEKEEVDLVLIAGDIFDTYTPSTAAEELFYDAVDRLNCKGRRAVVVIAGNHDSPDRLCAASPLAYKNGIILLGYPGSDPGTYGVNGSNIKITRSGRGWMELEIAGCGHNAVNRAVIIALPYPSEARLEQVLSSVADEALLQQAYSDRIGSMLQELSAEFREDTVNLIVGHLYMRGGSQSDSERQLGGALMVDPAVLPDRAHYIALGHLHRPQKVGGAPALAYYSGSPLAYSFSETDYSKLVLVVDITPGSQPVEKKIFLNSGKPLRRWEARNGIEEALQWCEEGRDTNAWIDLEIHTQRVLTSEEQKKLRELHPGIVNIRPVLKAEADEVVEYRSRESKRMDELFKDYYKHRMGAEIASEIMETFLDVINSEDEENLATGGGGFEAEVS